MEFTEEQKAWLKSNTLETIHDACEEFKRVPGVYWYDGTLYLVWGLGVHRVSFSTGCLHLASRSAEEVQQGVLLPDYLLQIRHADMWRLLYKLIYGGMLKLEPDTGPIPYEHEAICKAFNLPRSVYIAMDSTGCVFAYQCEPQPGGVEWAYGRAMRRLSYGEEHDAPVNTFVGPRAINTKGIDWRESLLCPPEGAAA